MRPVAARDRIAAQGPSRSGQPCGTDRRRWCMCIASPSRSARPECCGACGNAERAVGDGSTGSGSCRSTCGGLVSALCRPGGGDSGALHAPLTGCPSTGQVWAWVRRRPRSVVSYPMNPAHQGRNEATQSAARIRAWNTGRRRNDAARASAVDGASPPLLPKWSGSWPEHTPCCVLDPRRLAVVLRRQGRLEVISRAPISGTKKVPDFRCKLSAPTVGADSLP